jgi:hypothetical protein
MSEMVCVDEKSGIIQITSSGTVSLEELSHTLDEVLRIIESEKLSKILVDATGTNKLPFIFHLHILAREISSRVRGTFHAIIVAKQTPVEMSLIENATSHREKNIKIFTSREDALPWLMA